MLVSQMSFGINRRPGSLLRTMTLFCSGKSSPRNRTDKTTKVVALGALCALGAYGASEIRSVYRKRKEHRFSQAVSVRENLFINIAGLNTILGIEETDRPIITQEQTEQGIEHFIDRFYSKNLPSRESLYIPLPQDFDLKRANGATLHTINDVKHIKYTDLTRAQKIYINNSYAHDHGQLKPQTPGILVNRRFIPSAQRAYLSKDPRESHGNDHSVRAAIFISAFAYLYNKYHPIHGGKITQDQVRIAQIAAAAHDSGRQTEGTDFYDSVSTNNLREYLRDTIGIEDEALLEEACLAISNKDEKRLESKGLISHLVQNADCAEFARLRLKGPSQDKDDFNNSRQYLDIYQEMASSTTGEDKLLRDGLTFKDFMYELDAIRKEMNEFIYSTHKKHFRQSIANGSKSYYSAFSAVITSARYPALYHALHPTSYRAIKPNKRLLRKTIQSDHLALLPNPLNSFSNTTMTDLVNQITECDTSEKAKALDIMSRKLLHKYKDIPEYGRPPELLTTIALAFETVAYIYMNTGSGDFQAVLEFAGTEIPAEERNPLSSISTLGRDDDPQFILRDGGSLRKRKVRVAHKKYEDYHIYELSLELTSAYRTKLESFILAIREKESETFSVEEVPSSYNRISGEIYSEREPLTIEDKTTTSKDYKITFPDLGVTILIGKDIKFFNQHRLLRLNIETNELVNDTLLFRNIHQAFCRIGLPMVSMESRQEDIQKEALARVLDFRFPELVFEAISIGGVKANPDDIYASLNAEEKRIAKDDLRYMEIIDLGSGQIELVNPRLGQEASDRGCGALGSFINAGNFETTAEILCKILSSGILSSQERFQRGLFGLGCVPIQNYQTGSGNQAFTRAFSKRLFNEHFNLSKFAVAGPMMIMLSPQAFERMPYSYLKDRGGLRNPDYKQRLFLAQKQIPILNYNGRDRIMDRQGFSGLLENLNRDNYPLTETMFDHFLSAKYITKIIVFKTADRLRLMEILNKKGISEINGINLREVIIASETLNADMLK